MPAPRLPRGMAKLLDQRVDDAFDRMLTRLLGHAFTGKRMFVSFHHDLTLPGIFEAATTMEGGRPDLDLMQGIAEVAKDYLDKHKAEAKAATKRRIQGLLYEVDQGNIEQKDFRNHVERELSELWDRVRNNVERVVETEVEHASTIGTKDAIDQVNSGLGIDDPTVCFIPVKDDALCDECRRTHLLKDGVTPRVWKASEVSTDYHVRGEDRPSWHKMHPHCRCALATVLPGFGFDSMGRITWRGREHDEYAHQRAMEKNEDQTGGALAKAGEGVKTWTYAPEMLEEPKGFFDANTGDPYWDEEWEQEQPTLMPLASLKAFTDDPDRRRSCGISRHGKKGDPKYPHGRPESCDEYIDAMADAMRQGQQFPPLLLERKVDGSLGTPDGNHRIQAARRAGMTHAPVIIKRRKKDFQKNEAEQGERLAKMAKPARLTLDQAHKQYKLFRIVHDARIPGMNGERMAVTPDLPRIGGVEGEDRTTKRVSVAPTIHQAAAGVTGWGSPDEWDLFQWGHLDGRRVYGLRKLPKGHVPNHKLHALVPDAKETGEEWLTEPAEMEYVGHLVTHEPEDYLEHGQPAYLERRDPNTFMPPEKWQQVYGTTGKSDPEAGEPLHKHDVDIDRLEAEFKNFGWTKTKGSAHSTRFEAPEFLRNKGFVVRPIPIKNEHASRSKQMDPKMVATYLGEGGLRMLTDGRVVVKPGHPYAAHYQAAGHQVEGMEPPAPPKKTWTPNVPHVHVPIEKLDMSVATMNGEQGRYHHALKSGQHHLVPPVRAMKQPDGSYLAEDGFDQVEAAKTHGMNHIPVVEIA